jgi:hypothetical protein
MSRRWPRFSILTLLLLTTVVAMAIVIALLWSKVVPLQLQVARLQAEMGRLHVSDSQRPQAIAVETNEPLTWRWRVYLPPLPHGKYHFNLFEGLHDEFNAQNLTQMLDRMRRSGPNYEFRSDNNVTLSGEITIEAKLVNREGHWFLQVPPFGETRLGLPEVWKDLGIPQRDDLSTVVDKSRELVGLNSDRLTIFGRGDSVPLLILQGPPTPIANSSMPKSPPTSASSTLMLWIDYTP